MRATPIGASTPDDLDALIAAADPLAPAPGNHAEHVLDRAEEGLLHRIKARVDTATDADPFPAATTHTATRRRHRLRWPVVVTPIAAVAVAAMTAVLLTGTGPQPTLDGEGGGRPSASVTVSAGDPAAAPVFLGELATAAAATPSPIPRPDQYVYIRSLVASIDLTPAYEGTGPAVQEGLVARETWISQDPDGGVGLIREDGHDTRLNPQFGGGGEPSRYAALATLPTDPKQLIDHVASTIPGGSEDPAYAAFTAIGDLLADSLAPPATAAALYQAAALIPGVELVPDAVDAAGRTGVGVALVRDGQRSEWVFDPATHTYLGARSYLETDSSWGPAGTLTGLSAVLARGVTSDAGSVPRGDELID